MFGFLELSDRVDYNPLDFCSAFKSGGESINVRLQQDVTEFVGKAFEGLED